jgi:thimet oligopeptidase
MSNATQSFKAPETRRPRHRIITAFALGLALAASGCGAEGEVAAPPAVGPPPPPAAPPKPIATAAPKPPPVEPSPLDVDPMKAELTPSGMTRHCDAGVRRAEILWETVRALASAPERKLTWDATLGTLDAVTLALRSAGDYPELIAVAHPDKAVRDAAKDCAPKVERAYTAVLLDDATAAVVRRFVAKHETLSPVRARYLERIQKELRRNGAELDAAGKARLRELNDAITRTTQDFSANLANATLAIEVDEKTLEGLPQPYVESHKKNAKSASGKIRITTDYPDFFPFMQFAKDRKAALELYSLFDNRAAEKNVPLLERLLKLRQEKARLLGYATWADFVLELRMAKNPTTVASFLDDLQKHVAPIVKTEMKELEGAAKKNGTPPDKDGLPPSDRLFLEELVRKAKYGVDAKEVSEYFEVEHVKKGLLATTSELFGIQFREAPRDAWKPWHPDVTAYDVFEGDRLLGRFAMDLHPREGKYKHAAVFSIRDTRTMADGSRLVPLAAIMCNFPKPGAGPDAPPALLTHAEVSTFFHEFGHVLHHMLSTAELSTFAGTNVARDFVEAPSQMLEEWTWSKKVLDRFAHHYKTEKPIPAALFDKMTKARGFGRAVHTQRQLFLASLDQAYHAVPEVPQDSNATVRDVWKKTMPFRFVDGTHFQASFGHLMEYDAGYYGYQWALAIARDLFSRFDKEGLMTTKVARDYRDRVLAPGSSDDENRLIEGFLGRPFSRDPYKRFLSAGADYRATIR